MDQREGEDMKEFTGFTEAEKEKMSRQQIAMAALYTRINEGGVMFVGMESAQVIEEFEQALIAMKEIAKGFSDINEFIRIYNAALDAAAAAQMLFEDDRYINLN